MACIGDVIYHVISCNLWCNYNFITCANTSQITCHYKQHYKHFTCRLHKILQYLLQNILHYLYILFTCISDHITWWKFYNLHVILHLHLHQYYMWDYIILQDFQNTLHDQLHEMKIPNYTLFTSSFTNAITLFLHHITCFGIIYINFTYIFTYIITYIITWKFTWLYMSILHVSK